MVNYQLGKIYKIVDNTNGNIYIGSTTEPTLSRRLAQHKNDYKNYLNGNHNFVTSFEILKNENYEIVLQELYPCNSKDELHSRERYWIESNECVNKYIPTRTGKEWYEQNKEVILEKTKKYRKQNKELIKEINKQYREQNKEHIIELNKQYREQNKEVIAEKTKQPYTCVCGSVYRIDGKSHHFKTKKHQLYLEQNNV